MLKSIYVLLLSMVPVVELRGGIPFGLLSGLGYTRSVIFSIIGNLLPIPFLLVYGRKVLFCFAGFEKFGVPFRWILSLGEKKVARMRTALFIGLWLFVAVPLPGTGAWTGALIAITLNLSFKRSFPAIALGVLSAAAIITFMLFLFDITLF